MSQSLPILYSFRRCPFAMRARLALYGAKIAHEHREIDLKNKPIEMLALSPKGTVPVLQLPDGTLLEESLDIMIWASGQLPLSRQDREIIQENDTTFKYALDRYKYPGRYSEDDAIDYRGECERFLIKIEARLDPFMSGDSPTLVDRALFPFVRQFVLVDPEWFALQPYSQLRQWLDFFEASSLFQEIIKKYALWSPGDESQIVDFKLKDEE